jgi:hypothetical protein
MFLVPPRRVDLIQQAELDQRAIRIANLCAIMADPMGIADLIALRPLPKWRRFAHLIIDIPGWGDQQADETCKEPLAATRVLNRAAELLEGSARREAMRPDQWQEQF